MKRRKFLGLLGLLGCKDELENMSKKKEANWWWMAASEPDPFSGPEYTNGSNQQAFLLIGDSIARGNSTAPGTTPTVGTVYQYDADTDSVVEVGADDLLENQAAGTIGSPWPRFGIDYNSAIGKKPTFVCTAIGGGHWYTAAGGGALSWYTNGPLYANAVTKANNALTAIGVTKFRAVFIIMGYNDVSNNSGTTYAHMTSLIDRINTDFSTPNIYLSFNNKDNALTDTTLFQRQVNMKKFIRQLSYDYSNVELFMSLETLDFRSSSYYQVDAAHLTFAGNEYLGSALARQLTLSNSYHKHSRFIIASFESVLSDARKTLIDNFIQSQDTAGNLELIDALYWFKAPTEADTILDWFGLSTPVGSGSPTFSINSNLATNGSSNRIASSFCVSRVADKSNPLSDILIGARIKTNTDGLGLDGCLFGVREGATTSIIDLAQGTTDLQYRLSSAGATTYAAGDDYFVSDTFHGEARNGSTIHLIKGKAVISSASVASSTLASTANHAIQLGCRNNNGTIDRFLGAEYLYFVVAKYSTFNLDSFHDEIETLIAGW